MVAGEITLNQFAKTIFPHPTQTEHWRDGG
jgi:hypothetical protein